MSDFAHELKSAEDVARRAGKLMLEVRATGMSVSPKGRDDVVTNIDIAVEKFLKGELRRMFPDDGLVGEETGSESPDKSRQWVVDPVDGTRNLTYDLPLSSVSVALQIDGVSVVGVVYHPHLDELFSTCKGSGVHMNGNEVRPTVTESLAKAMVGAKPTPNQIGPFNAIAAACCDVRRLGTAALELAYVAAGRLDGIIEYGLQPWDTAAGYLLVQQAGGRVTTFDGESFDASQDSMVASNGHIHDQMLAALRER